MMKIRSIGLKLSVLFSAAIAALAMTGPATTRAAAPPIVLALSNPAFDCGSYTGKPAVTGADAAINDAPSGSTIVVCPGTYPMAGLADLVINGKTLTIKRAVKGTTPVLTIKTTASAGIAITDSTVSIDGLMLNAASNTQANYTGLMVTRSSVKLKNIGLIGPNVSGASGIFIMQVLSPKTLAVSITDCYIAGYSSYGIYIDGPAKFTISGCHLNGTDGGRVAGNPGGITISGWASGWGSPVGSVTGCVIINNIGGITVSDASGITISKNTLSNFRMGISVGHTIGNPHNTDNIKITGNTLFGVPSDGIGVYVRKADAVLPSMKKLSITGNTFVASPFVVGSPNTAVMIQADVPALALVSAAINSNKFLGFALANRIINYNNNATVTSNGNESMP